MGILNFLVKKSESHLLTKVLKFSYFKILNTLDSGITQLIVDVSTKQREVSRDIKMQMCKTKAR